MKFTAVINHIACKAGVLSVLLALLCSVGCNAVYEFKDAPLSVDANLRLLFAVPSETKADTYDYADPANNEAMDNVITATDLEIYFFTEEGEFVTSVGGRQNIEVLPYSSGVYDPHYHMYTANMKVEGIIDGQRYRVVVLANKRSTHVSSLPFCVTQNRDWLTAAQGSTDEEKLYNSLLFNFSEPGEDTVADFARWGWNHSTAGSVPMWGFNTLNVHLATIDAHGYHEDVAPSGQIDMLRSIAKVKIEINPELFDNVRLTDYSEANHTGGVRLISSMPGGYMVPSYGKFSGLSQTPSILNKDREGGLPSGAYTNDWINSLENMPSSNVYPFFLASDGSYYIYLPEHKMSQAWMQLEFEWKASELYVGGKPLKKDYKLHFADYPQNGEVATEDELNYFPVMRNHYYVYTISNLSLKALKYEVCDWAAKSTNVEFN